MQYGFPLVPMISGIAEMVLRIGAISLLIGQTGFKATAYAEICAWTGALVLNASAYKIIFAREKGKTMCYEEKETNADTMNIQQRLGSRITF